MLSDNIFKYSIIYYLKEHFFGNFDLSQSKFEQTDDELFNFMYWEWFIDKKNSLSSKKKKYKSYKKLPLITLKNFNN